MRRLALLPLLLLAACATPETSYLQGSKAEVMAETENQKALALQQDYKNNLRIARISQPLLTRNTAFCGDKVAPYYGLSVWTADQLGSGYQDAAARVFGLDGGVNIYAAVPGSPAANAGLKSGDKIVGMNGHDIKDGKDGVSQVKRALGSDKSVTLDIQRGKGKRSVHLTPVAACDFKVVIDGAEDVNAFADGEKVHINAGMLRFARNDGELAVVIGHELGHNVGRHSDKKMQNAMSAGMVGLLMDLGVAAAGGAPNGDFTRLMSEQGASAYSVSFEQEADYIGLYMTARAGYSISDAPNFWRRMASEVDANSIETRTSHPTSPERFVALQKTVAEINAKRAAGKALYPNMAEKPVASAPRKSDFN